MNTLDELSRNVATLATTLDALRVLCGQTDLSKPEARNFIHAIRKLVEVTRGFSAYHNEPVELLKRAHAAGLFFDGDPS